MYTLGIYLNNDGSWHKQISYIKEKAWEKINIMRRLKFVFDRKSLKLFTSFSLDPFWNMVMKPGTTVSNMIKKITKGSN